MTEEFSELLKRYIKNSGFTIYQLSEICGVNRTTIQKAITAGRIPQKEAFQKITSVLNLTRAEHKKLLDAYEIASDGSYLYYQRKYLKTFLEKASALTPSASVVIDANDHQNSFFPIEGSQIIQGYVTVEETLKALLYDELHTENSPAISLFLPMDQEIFNGFFMLLQSCEDLTVNQQLYLIKNPSVYENVEFHNLKVLSHLFPLILTATADYHVYYSYNEFVPSMDATTGFPYYILFSHCTVLLSPDLNTAWLSVNSDLASYLRKRFETITQQSKKLILQSNTVEDYLEKSTALYANAHFNYSIEYQPCLLPFMNEELVNALANPSLSEKEMLTPLLADCRKQFHALKKNIILFTQKGLEDFIRTGIILNIPKGYARACNLKERMFLLEQIAAECEFGHILMRCINPAYFSIEKQIYLSLQNNQEVSFFFYNAEDHCFRLSGIRENTIYAAFADFIEYTLESDYVYSKDETLQIILDGIKRLSSQTASEDI